MDHSAKFYSLRHSCKILRRHNRSGKEFPACWKVVNEYRVREFCETHHCGLAEFGLQNDPFARGLLSK